ncbi:hypothetical protein HAX54_025857 [Datura stramonium]|uniref:Uncharacterized protein n=1 Tax=Datura stramonium TaxID=4076 RepID=A0ABS8V1F1_DATST|nr:hypothetical protein [Datura stramonium]
MFNVARTGNSSCRQAVIYGSWLARNMSFESISHMRPAITSIMQERFNFFGQHAEFFAEGVQGTRVSRGFDSEQQMALRVPFLDLVNFELGIKGCEIDPDSGCVLDVGNSFAGVSKNDSIWANSET